jgi:hypothetical protein
LTAQAFRHGAREEALQESVVIQKNALRDGE